MLGSLARWLRFLGYDTLYPEAMEDDEVLRLALDGRRLLLTRDRQLAARAGTGGILMESVELDEQMLQLKSVMGLRLDGGARMMRCSVCNHVLERATGEEAKRIASERKRTGGAAQIPDGALRRHDIFWICRGCGRLYWPGSHYERIMDKIGELEKGSKGTGEQGYEGTRVTTDGEPGSRRTGRPGLETREPDNRVVERNQNRNHLSSMPGSPVLRSSSSRHPSPGPR